MDNFSINYFPPQKLAYKDKDLDWRHQCVDGAISTCYTYGRTRRQTSRNKRRNYNLFNNKIDKADFDYVLNPFNLSKEKLREFNFPASLQPYDIMSPYFNLLLGEESKRLFDPKVFAVNEEAHNEKQELKKKEILGVLEAMLQSTVDPNQDPNQPPPVPELLKKYQDYTPKMMRESVSQKLLNHFYRSERLEQKFNDCFKDYLLAGEEIISVEKVGDGPQARRVNPLELWYQLRNNSDLMDDCEKIYERNQMTVSEIIDQFYEYLTPDQIDELETWGQGSGSPYNFGDQMLAIPEVASIYSFEESWTHGGLPVHRVRWNSKKKVGIHYHVDPDTNQEIEEPVEETFVLDKTDPTARVEWFWINEYWEGVRIGQDMYIDPLIRPRKQQFRSRDNLSENKSGYFGTVCSATNSQSTSMMDRLVPWIYLYLIIWYRAELAMAKNLGNIGIIDISLIPDSWEPEKWIYYAQQFGFGWVDSYSESNRSRAGNIANQSTQNKSLDLSQMQYINGHLDMLRFIEERIQNTCGISRQRLGEISTSELVGNTERAVVQSSHITEPYFAPHDFFKIRVCEALIEVAKECLEGKEKNFQYITDDLAPVLFAVDGDDFVNADYGVFVSNATKDQSKLDTFKQLMQAALQNDKVQLSQVASVLNSNNLSDIKTTLVQAEQETQQMIQQSEEQKMKAAQDLQQQKLDFERERLDREDTNKQLDRENNIQTATIKSEGAAELKSGELGVKQLAEQEKIALEKSKLDHDKAIEDRKLGLEQQKVQAEQARTRQELEKTHAHEVKENQKDREHEKQLEKIKAKARPKPGKK